MILLDYPFIAICFIACFTLLIYQGLLGLRQLMQKYKASFVESVNINLRDLFLLLNPEEILGISIAIALVTTLFAITVLGNVMLAVTCAIGSFFLPRIYLNYARKKRLALFGLQLIDGFTLVSNALRAGQSLPQAFSLLVTEMSPPISQEFGILTKEYELGIPMESCLQNMASRIKSVELQLFVNSILICGQTGGNLTETFDNITAVIRERIRLEGKIDSMTAEGRTQGLVLTLMPLFLGLAFYWVEPELIKVLFTTMVGRILLFFIVVLDLGAWFLTKKIVDIDV